MKFTKVFFDELAFGYAVMRLKAQDRDFVVVASEEDQPCYAYDLDDNYRRFTVWPDVGGTMTMVQIPGTLNFLATQRFYPGFNAAQCRIVKAIWNGVGWDQQVVGDFPYIHRFDLIAKPNRSGYWYVGCSIANSKASIDDWSDPGKIWIGDYDDQQAQIKNQHALDFLLVKNHGYKKMDGYSLITGASGIYKLIWPTAQTSWQIKQLTKNETSDIISADLDGDGSLEYLTIEGFHGPDLRLLDADFRTLKTSIEKTPFGHALWGGRLGQQEYIIFGWREGQCNLEVLSGCELKPQLIDEKVGPSNVLVYEKDQKQYLLSANREVNQVAIYLIEP